MLPGFNSDLFPGGGNNDKAQQLQIKRHITIIESMTEKELDSTNVKMLQVGGSVIVFSLSPCREIEKDGILFIICILVTRISGIRSGTQHFLAPPSLHAHQLTVSHFVSPLSGTKPHPTACPRVGPVPSRGGAAAGGLQALQQICHTGMDRPSRMVRAYLDTNSTLPSFLIHSFII